MVREEMGHRGGPHYQSFVLRRNGPSGGPPQVGEELGQLDGPLNTCFFGKNDGPPGVPPRMLEEMGHAGGSLYHSVVRGREVKPCC